MIERGSNPGARCGRSTGMWSVSDDALVAGLAAGDEDAASVFVGRFQRRVYGLARTIVADDRAAEDVAQEAFVRAWRHASTFDPRRGSVAGWLLTITRNLAIDAVRVRRPLAFDPAVLVGLDRSSEEREPHELVQLGVDTDRLRAALARLPEEQCRAIVLSGLLGYSAREVGEAENIPLGTAKTRIRAALIRLRAALVSEESTA
jgi:RNA polymerase sigma factor (sigma-70 family)